MTSGCYHFTLFSWGSTNYVCFKWANFGNGPDAAASIAPTLIRRCQCVGWSDVIVIYGRYTISKGCSWGNMMDVSGCKYYNHFQSLKHFTLCKEGEGEAEAMHV